ncbi:F0F1 ATP synthase subunit epsilon [Actinocrinis puniceicyclus]|uniref:ATP synthase epsilon chain n=1 Tax=Actinocrinis puniceicyclus TaxID=977794 RepID=A0A8J7WM47_9ACTN|nr:F0F1 ATP synthase subunit epsilon [Actinocrinis puniceicyclus]MBS2964891.1 F0F1 ATP synthase subunit epsilon [Actinocrinis puniceicyclus]
MAELEVALVAADREVWSGTASMVIAKTADGDVGVMPGHQPIMSVLKPSVAVIKTVVDGAPGDVLRVALHGGFIAVDENRVSLLSEAAELASEIDVPRAEEALARARAGEFDRDSEAAAERAELRLRATGRATAQ